MDHERRRALEASAGLFLMGLGLVVMLLNAVSPTRYVTVSILGLGLSTVGGFLYK